MKMKRITIFAGMAEIAREALGKAYGQMGVENWRRLAGMTPHKFIRSNIPPFGSDRSFDVRFGLAVSQGGPWAGVSRSRRHSVLEALAGVCGLVGVKN
jgi:hypothetical protein